ncbi:MAG: membrane integrity-associated transporter subunit PqiC [Rubrivivax sp.]|nr:membrane integrity-associated transporter subunit PqiC [Rubrivivax sp.]
MLSWLGASFGVQAGVTAGVRVGAAMATGAAALAQLAGCAASAVPPTIWLRLAAELPSAVGRPAPGAATPPALGGPAASGTTAAPAGEVWQLMLPLPLPAHLDRDSLFLPQGTSGALVRPLAGARWVEPLRDAVPRLLREDLWRRMGGRPLWAAPLPPGLAPTHQLRVEITTFEIGADGRTLATQARWSIADARGTRPPVAHEARIGTPALQPEAPESWALAHRQAIAALAERIAATMTVP